MHNGNSTKLYKNIPHQIISILDFPYFHNLQGFLICELNLFLYRFFVCLFAFAGRKFTNGLYWTEITNSVLLRLLGF